MNDITGKIKEKRANVVVVGLGYVGLPTAIEIAKKGYFVTGFDIHEGLVRSLMGGKSHIGDVPDSELKAALASKHFAATSDPSVLKKADVALLCVPTPLNKNKLPDTSYIESASESVARFLHSGMLVILESSTYPGTTREVVLPILLATGLKEGKDFFLAFSPERIDPGNRTHAFHTVARVVGGIGKKATSLAAKFYRSFLEAEVKEMSSPEAAEMTKILENTFRLVNISLVNELTLLAGKMGIDMWEVIEGAKTKPYGFMPFYPSPKVGGHCFSERQNVFIKRKGFRQTERISIKDLFVQYPAKAPYWNAVLPVPVFVGTNAQLQSEHDKGMTHSLPYSDTLKPVASRDIQVLSFNVQSGMSEFQDVEFLSKRKETTTLQIQAAYGHTLEVTEDHPVIVSDGKDGFSVKKSQDVQKGDWLLLSRRIPNITRARSLDLIDLVIKHPVLRTEHIRVRPAAVSFKSYRSILEPFLKEHPEKYSFYKHNVFPLSLYSQMEHTLGISRKDLLLCRGRGPSYSQIPAVISVDRDFARLVGYYLSEGCITKERKTSRIRFTFHEKEQEYVNDVTGILQRKGIAYSLWKDPNWKNIHIKISSAILSALFEEELFCGRNCYEMRIPDQIFYSNKILRKEVLKGLLRGDGGVDWSDQKHAYVKKTRHYTHNSNRIDVSYFSSSPMLFEQVQLLLLEMGIVPQIQKRAGLLRIMGSKNMRKLESIFLGEKQEKVERYLKHIRKEIDYRMTKTRKNAIALCVTNVRAVPTSEVYSLEVANTSTLLTNTGIIAHNCIPLDPFYLSWKAREHNFWARFIELAGEINEQMPHYVVTRIISVLNRHKKSVHGSKILVWGVSYKEDIGDPRESAAYDVISDLIKKRGIVEYFDPHVPEFQTRDMLLRSISYRPASIKKYDMVVILTGHSGFDYDELAKNAKLVVDTRNAIRSRAHTNVSWL